jgi:hypothetical protein
MTPELFKILFLTYSYLIFRGISFRRYDEGGNEILRHDLLFGTFKVQTKDDGTFVDNDPTSFGRRVHFYSKFNDQCPIFKHSQEVLEALTSKRAELIFKINPSEEGAELRQKAFEGLSFHQFIRFARPGQDMIPVGVFIRNVDQGFAAAPPPQLPSIEDFTF